MPEYICRVGTPRGQIMTRSVYAENPEQARKELVDQGYWVFEVRPKRRLKDLFFALIGLKRRGLPIRDFLVFNQELATLIQAGLPILQCLDILAERQRNPRLRYILENVRERVRAGASLSEAFEDHVDTIPRLYIANIYAGERSGQLVQVIRRYIDYTNLVYELRKKIYSSLTYPVILFALSIGLLSVLFLYVIPRFVDFYAGLEAELPFITVLVVSISGKIQIILPILFVLAIAGYLTYQMTSMFQSRLRKRIHRWLLRLRIFGPIMYQYGIAQFAHTLATLISGGLPLVHSLEVAAGSVWNEYLRDLILQARAKVREGMSLHDALENVGIQADLLLEMVRVGESTGALFEMLEHAAHFYDEDVTLSVQRIMALIEPVLLVVMGLIVLIVLLSVYYPIFTLATRIQTG